jgi:hypothetical protein
MGGISKALRLGGKIWSRGNINNKLGEKDLNLKTNQSLRGLYKIPLLLK